MIKLNNNISLDIATASNRRAAKWQNKRTDWEELVNTLSNTERTPETIKQYFSFTKDRQDDIKDVGGFVGGYLRGGKRKKGHVEYRQVICLDVDFGDFEVWQLFVLMELAGCMYTTHKHTSESPRFRIVIPLSRKVTPDEYEAIARVIASWLGIDRFDDTTYQPTRLMYYPSTSKNGEFVFDHSDGKILSPDEVLAELPSWKDPTTWPVSSRVKETIQPKRADKVEDPEEKGGIIGAFCRAYPMYDALAEFLAEVYTPCEELGEDRYSLIGASTSGGLVVYDNKLAYSHHSTDATAGKLCNAFDLVRLHKFGDLDEKAKPNTEVTKLPSYIAMAEFAGKLGPVKKEIVRERRGSADDYDELEVGARKKATDDEWVGDLTLVGKSNTVEGTIENAYIILNNDTNLKGRIKLNLHSMWDEVWQPFMWDKYVDKYPRPISDSDLNHIRHYIEKCYGINNEKTILTAIKNVGYDNGYHPLKDYLDGLPEWDGVQRAEDLLIKLFGAADTPYTRAVTVKTLCAAVKRIYHPGEKFDHVLTLIGTGGCGKSTLLAKLGGQWHTDNVRITTDQPNNLAIMRGRWILEIAEMRGFSKQDSEFSKQFISRVEDIYRRPYDRMDIVYRRQSIFIGTHNKSDFLHDETGNRRYWPVQCTRGKEAAADVWSYLTPVTVAQIWAEAKERVAQGETLYLSQELEQQAEIVQGQHMESDPWEKDVLTYIADKTEVTTKEIWEMALLGNRPIARAESNRIVKTMTRTKEWEYKSVRRDDIVFKAWVKKDEDKKISYLRNLRVTQKEERLSDAQKTDNKGVSNKCNLVP